MAYIDKQKDAECKARYQKANPEKHRKAALDYAKRNPDKVRAKQRKWMDNNPEKVILSHAKTRAKKKGIEFTIDSTDVVIPDVCPILGITLQMGGTDYNNSPSLDRIDSTKGYIKGNVWVISWRANRIKSDSTLEELEKIVAALKGRNLSFS